MIGCFGRCCDRCGRADRDDAYMYGPEASSFPHFFADLGKQMEGNVHLYLCGRVNIERGSICCSSELAKKYSRVRIYEPYPTLRPDADPVSCLPQCDCESYVVSA